MVGKDVNACGAEGEIECYLAPFITLYAQILLLLLSVASSHALPLILLVNSNWYRSRSIIGSIFYAPANYYYDAFFQ